MASPSPTTVDTNGLIKLDPTIFSNVFEDGDDDNDDDDEKNDGDDDDDDDCYLRTVKVWKLGLASLAPHACWLLLFYVLPTRVHTC